MSLQSLGPVTSVTSDVAKLATEKVDQFVAKKVVAKVEKFGTAKVEKVKAFEKPITSESSGAGAASGRDGAVVPQVESSLSGGTLYCGYT